MISRTRLTLVLGSGEGGQSSALLRAVPAGTAHDASANRRGPLQLTIPVLTQRSETVVSASSDRLSVGLIERLIGATHVRRIVDIRASPSFQGPRCASAAFFRALADFRVTYQHVPELSNPHIAESWSDQGWVSRYREHLRVNAKPYLVRLREQVDKGPLLLISRDLRHDGSERECVIEELAEINSDFDLTVAEL